MVINVSAFNNIIIVINSNNNDNNCSLCQGVVAMVTGGASGLGRACVERVVREGGRVVVADLPTSGGSALAKELGESAVFAPLDVSLIFLSLQ